MKDLGSVLQLLDKLLIFRSEVLEINSFESFSDIVQALFDHSIERIRHLIGQLIHGLYIIDRNSLVPKFRIEHVT